MFRVLRSQHNVTFMYRTRGTETLNPKSAAAHPRHLKFIRAYARSHLALRGDDGEGDGIFGAAGGLVSDGDEDR